MSFFRKKLEVPDKSSALKGREQPIPTEHPKISMAQSTPVDPKRLEKNLAQLEASVTALALKHPPSGLR